MSNSVLQSKRTKVYYRASNDENSYSVRTSQAYPKPAIRSPLSVRDSNSCFKPKDRDTKAYPVPKGNTCYAKAKKAEYMDKDLSKAEMYYKLAIQRGDRAESALKDLAGLLHQQGRTTEACEILKNHKSLFSDVSKYENLLNSLKKQVIAKGNSLNKYVKISHISDSFQDTDIKHLFKNSSRVVDIDYGFDFTPEGKVRFAVMKFKTHSAARKTLEGLLNWDTYKIEWVSITGEVIGEAIQGKAIECKKQFPLFNYKLFLNPVGENIYPIPVDEEVSLTPSGLSDWEGILLLGPELYSEIVD